MTKHSTKRPSVATAERLESRTLFSTYSVGVTPGSCGAVNEGSSGYFHFTISCGGVAPPGGATISFTVGGAADSPSGPLSSDSQLRSGSVTIPAGQDHSDVSFVNNDDDIFWGDVSSNKVSVVITGAMVAAPDTAAVGPNSSAAINLGENDHIASVTIANMYLARDGSIITNMKLFGDGGGQVSHNVTLHPQTGISTTPGSMLVAVGDGSSLTITGGDTTGTFTLGVDNGPGYGSAYPSTSVTIGDLDHIDWTSALVPVNGIRTMAVHGYDAAGHELPGVTFTVLAGTSTHTHITKTNDATHFADISGGSLTAFGSSVGSDTYDIQGSTGTGATTHTAHLSHTITSEQAAIKFRIHGGSTWNTGGTYNETVGTPGSIDFEAVLSDGYNVIASGQVTAAIPADDASERTSLTPSGSTKSVSESGGFGVVYITPLAAVASDSVLVTLTTPWGDLVSGSFDLHITN